MKAFISALDYALPTGCLTNQDLAQQYPGWTAEKIEEKTGIVQRHVAAPGECSSDLAVAAARNLFASGACAPADVDYLLLCTQSPDYFLPSTACLVQHQLGLSTHCGALDFNLGCSGFVYGLGLAKGLVESRQAKRVLLITAETYSKFIHPGDKSVRTIFGDAAAATLIAVRESSEPLISGFAFGTDGSGAENLIVPTGGLRRPVMAGAPETEDESGNRRTVNHLFMNGPEIFTFTLRIVPETVQRVLAAASLTLDQIDLFVFHQANRYMLEHLRKKLKVPPDKFVISMADCGNTVSSTIPIALKQAAMRGTLRPGQVVMILGFGVGYSWAGAVLRWV